MKANSKHTALFVSLVAAGMLAASAGQAATMPTSIFDFTATATDDVFSVKSTSWRDPAFGLAGWTHSSDWGTFVAKKGDTVTIKLMATDAGMHPGITVWYRGADDTAPDTYVDDHFYQQNANVVRFGATDETSGEPIGNIVMQHVAHAYDADGNKIYGRMRPLKDDVPGQLELSFKAPKKGLGHYQFVVGGFNPDAGVDTAVKHDVNVTVTVTAP